MKVNTLIFVISALIFLPGHHFAYAQEDQDLNEIMEGFEGEEASGGELQEVMDGFEDDTSAGGETQETNQEEILEGFDVESKETQPALAEENYLPSFLSIDGYFKLSTVYAYLAHDAAGTDTGWHGLTRLRSEIKLEMDADLSDAWQARVSGHAFYDFAYRINGRDDYTDDVLDNYTKGWKTARIFKKKIFLRGLCGSQSLTGTTPLT